METDGAGLARHQGMVSEHPDPDRHFARTEVGHERPPAGDLVIQAVQHGERRVHRPGAVPLTGSHEHIAPSHVAMGHTDEVDGQARAGLRRLAGQVVALQGPDANHVVERQQQQLVLDAAACLRSACR